MNQKRISSILTSLVIILFSNCNGYSQKEQVMSNDVKIDKEQIADCFIQIVEHYRLHPFKYDLKYPESAKYYDQHPDERDYSNLFEPYSTYYKSDKEGYKPLPLPSWENIKVSTDSIFYSHDSLICFAFLAIKVNVQQNVETRKIGREYDAVSVMGIRNNSNEPFDIFPITEYKAIGYDSYEKAIVVLTYFYFNRLAKQKDFRGNQFKANVNSKKFWEKSLYLKKFDGLYYFQTHMPAGKNAQYIKHEIITCRGASE